MKMKLPFIIASLALSFTVAGCGNNNIPETIVPTSSLMSIVVTKNPNKTTYLINEEFDSTGLEVTATYRDKTTAVVTEYTLSGFSSETAGVKTITVSYKRKTTSFTVNVVETSVNPTGITLSPTSLTLYPNQGKALTVIFAPSNANSNLGLTWSSNSSVITVDDGMVFASASATTSDTAIITATSTYDSSITASVNVTIEEEPAPTQDAWTIMIYLCGSDLESGNGLATSDLKEILSVAGQPDDVNIIVQTGGASSWYSTYGISASKLGRYHIENKSLKLDASLTYASMGLTSTFQSFLEWGLTNYPAEKMYSIMQEWIFPFIKSLHNDKESAYSKYMQDAIFKLPTPLLLSKVVDSLDEIYDLMNHMQASDVRGDVYEYLLSKIAQSGRNGQFRTPRHIIKMMVELMKPSADDMICDETVA